MEQKIECNHSRLKATDEGGGRVRGVKNNRYVSISVFSM